MGCGIRVRSVLCCGLLQDNAWGDVGSKCGQVYGIKVWSVVWDQSAVSCMLWYSGMQRLQLLYFVAIRLCVMKTLRKEGILALQQRKTPEPRSNYPQLPGHTALHVKSSTAHKTPALKMDVCRNCWAERTSHASLTVHRVRAELIYRNTQHSCIRQTQIKHQGRSVLTL